MAETVGSLVDKISIINLKIYHFGEQLDRRDAGAAHKKMVKEKIRVLRSQEKDLETELSCLIDGLFSGKSKLKIYRQFKMYNDPRYRSKNG